MTRPGSPIRFRPAQGMVLTLWATHERAAWRPPTGESMAPKLLLVGLDDGDVSRRGGVGVETCLTQRAPLPQEIPALVERHLELLEASAIGVVRRPSSLALPKPMLLLDECFDGPVYLLIVHGSMLENRAIARPLVRFRGGGRCAAALDDRSFEQECRLGEVVATRA